MYPWRWLWQSHHVALVLVSQFHSNWRRRLGTGDTEKIDQKDKTNVDQRELSLLTTAQPSLIWPSRLINKTRLVTHRTASIPAPPRANNKAYLGARSLITPTEVTIVSIYISGYSRETYAKDVYGKSGISIAHAFRQMEYYPRSS